MRVMRFFLGVVMLLFASLAGAMCYLLADLSHPGTAELPLLGMEISRTVAWGIAAAVFFVASTLLLPLGRLRGGGRAGR